MLVHISKRERFPMIHVVRRAAQVELLRGLGAEHVLLSTTTTFSRSSTRCRTSSTPPRPSTPWRAP
jgi:hypothetical protein